MTQKTRCWSHGVPTDGGDQQGTQSLGNGRMVASTCADQSLTQSMAVWKSPWRRSFLKIEESPKIGGELVGKSAPSMGAFSILCYPGNQWRVLSGNVYSSLGLPGKIQDTQLV